MSREGNAMTWVQAIQSKLPFTGPPERRSESQIDGDLDDEFAFHLEMKTRELMEEGYNPEAARGLAVARFGNIEHIKQRCKRIALEERIMLQRVNFVLMIVVALMVIGVGAQVMITQRYNTVALMDITSQIAKMRLDAAAEAKDRGWAAPQQAQPPRATLAPGDVVTAEIYELMHPNMWEQVTRTIEADGALRLPVIGEFHAAGKTPRALEEEVRQKAKNIIQDPQVSVYAEMLTTGDSSPPPNRSGETLQIIGRVMVTGEVEMPGWMPLGAHELTRFVDLLDRAGVRNDQWVRITTGRAGVSRTYPASWIREHEQDRYARPGDEIHIQDQVSIEAIRQHHLEVALRDEFTGSRWVQVRASDPQQSEPWTLEFIATRGSYPAGILKMGDNELSFSLRRDGVHLFDNASGNEPREGSADWTVNDEGHLIFDLSNIRPISPIGMRLRTVSAPRIEPPSAPVVFQIVQ
jgi:protein involved in polysaccharide export with SLBB domain